jgi:hypothetical protein
MFGIAFWWLIIPLVILGLLVCCLYGFTRERPLVVIWGLFILICAIWWRLDADHIAAFLVAGGSAAFAITLAVLRYNSKSNIGWCSHTNQTGNFCTVCGSARRAQ